MGSGRKQEAMTEAEWHLMVAVKNGSVVERYYWMSVVAAEREASITDGQLRRSVAGNDRTEKASA